MRRLPAIILSAAVLGGTVTAVSVSTALPAVAAPGDGSSSGCSGQSCVASIYGKISVTSTGNVSAGTPSSGGGGTLPVIHCWLQPWLDAKQMQTWWDQQSLSTIGSEGGQALEPYADAIDQHAKKPDKGMWWRGENDGSMAGTTNACTKLPLLEWVPPGQEATAVAQFIDPKFLAEYAAASVVIHDPTLQARPQDKTFVTIPTTVYVTSSIAPGHVTASIFNGAESETVKVTAQHLKISTALAGAIPYPGSGTCASAAGSTVVTGKVPVCGFVFKQPSVGAVTITGTQTWQATWNGALTNAQPAPGVNTTQLGAVDEIQSTN